MKHNSRWILKLLSTLANPGTRLGTEMVDFTITKGPYTYYWSHQGSYHSFYVLQYTFIRMRIFSVPLL